MVRTCTMLMMIALAVAAYYLGIGAMKSVEFLSFSHVDLTVEQLEWARNKMDGTAVGSEPTGKQIPVSDLLAGGSALVAAALLWSASIIAKLLLALIGDPDY